MSNPTIGPPPTVLVLQSIGNKVPVAREEKSSSMAAVDKPAHAHHYSHASASFQQTHASLRRKQKRLQLLHHASVCSRRDGECCELVHCMAMKRLYHHVIVCRQHGQCVVPGCRKWRRVWQHFESCTNDECAVCLPVKTADPL